MTVVSRHVTYQLHTNCSTTLFSQPWTLGVRTKCPVGSVAADDWNLYKESH